MDHSLLVTAVKSTIEGDSESSNASIKSTIEGDSESVTAIALSHDDKFLFSASHSRQISMWDLSSLKCLHSWKGGHQGPIMAMICHTYGESELQGHFCTHSFKGHKGVVTSVIFHPDPTCWLVRFHDLHPYAISKQCIVIITSFLLLALFWI
ncbi:putative transcription factor WD40-like family [Helianthus annuus]|uniref:Transcription factor WD40-like family n=1 Tax=Helianthus annuus TaxID=4232 RepID=A0A9K3JCG6_HELAN|nr:putative transcription factor WD40-like family [Helianthus annuus]KAJ0606807.1 putative transcription factor WD40-like family [Helianthus annuus]KAJ0934164.1 putative transcription factor WD40-like family [Helianthus annuus]